MLRKDATGDSTFTPSQTANIPGMYTSILVVLCVSLEK